MPQRINERQYRNITARLSPQIISSSAERPKYIDTDYYVEGYATTFTEPYLLYEFAKEEYYERVMPDALVGADLSDVIMQYDHRGKVFARTTNGTLGLQTDAHGLLIYADLSKSAEARNMHEEIRAELVTKMSWGFTIEDEEYDREHRLFTIKRIKKVYDVSAVSIPADDATTISARNRIEGISEKRRLELDEIMRRKITLKIKINTRG